MMKHKTKKKINDDSYSVAWKFSIYKASMYFESARL